MLAGLPDLADPLAEPANVEQALSKAQIQSNWLLLERMRLYPNFRDVTYAALDSYLTEFVDFGEEILQLLCDCFGVRA